VFGDRQAVGVGKALLTIENYAENPIALSYMRKLASKAYPLMLVGYMRVIGL